jgi:putative ABC transport system permease protein
VAFSFLALMTAALCLRSIQRAYAIDPGFDAKKLAVFLTNTGQAGYSQAQTKQFYKDARARVAALPGIASVSWSSNLPLWSPVSNGLRIEGRPQRSKSDTISSVVNTVDVDYFSTTGIGIIRGRDFQESDQETSMPVAIINETMANKYWPNGDAIGKRIQLPGEKFYRQIVGIAKRADYTALAETPQSCVYLPLAQDFRDGMTLFARAKGDPQQILAMVQREIRLVGPQVEVSDARTGTKIIDQALTTAKMGVTLLGVFGLLALGLASIGLYGVMAYSVNRRTREIGVRMALGAERRSVLRLILGQGMTLVGTGVVIGLALSLLVGRMLSRFLFGVSAGDPASMVSTAVVLLAVAMIACYVPARRASRVDPIVALREA